MSASQLVTAHEPEQKVGEPLNELHGVFEPLPNDFVQGEDTREVKKLGGQEVPPAEPASQPDGATIGESGEKETADLPEGTVDEVGEGEVKEEKKEKKTTGELDITFTDEETIGVVEKAESEDAKQQEETDDSKELKETVSEEALRRQVEEEGFLESVGPQEPKKGKNLLGVLGFQYIGDVFEGGKKFLAKQEEKLGKKQWQKEKNEEKEWREEAKRREKLLEERKVKQAQELEEEAQKERKPVKFHIPKPKKQNGFLVFINSLNYMGLGKQRTAFIDNLSTMMGAGLPLLDALRSLQEEAGKKPMKKLIGRIIVAIETGSPLWRAMEGQYFFKPQEIAMVRVGEEAGNLVENLRYLAEQEEKDRGLRSKVKTAMIYPIIVLVMLTVIVFGLGLFILPNLVQVLKSLGADLPLTTRIIIAATEYLSAHARVIVPSFISGVLVFAILVKFTPLKIVVQWVLMYIPGVGALIREATISRFGVVMGGLLQAGVPITDALVSLVGVTGLARYHRFYTQLLEHVE
ncbi:MAG: type II secretion system F family protein, partial [Patescibacteria group bacterium]